MRHLLTWPLYKIGNGAFRAYIRLHDQNGGASTLIGTLAWLRSWAVAQKLDFRAALIASQRRGTDDYLTDMPLLTDGPAQTKLQQICDLVDPHNPCHGEIRAVLEAGQLEGKR